MEPTDERSPGPGHNGNAKVSPVNLAPADLAETFERLAAEAHAAEGPAVGVDSVVQFALSALDCSFAGIALHPRDGVPEIPALTDPVLAEIYQLQLDYLDGPLVKSLRAQTPVLVRDTNTETRWPEWAERVVNLGVRSVFHVPLVLGDAHSPTAGALGLYHPKPDAFDADDLAIAQVLAGRASVALAIARNEKTLATAADTQTIVGQAMGILMERFDLDGDRAFAVLRRGSQESGSKLRDTAQRLIDTRKLPR